MKLLLDDKQHNGCALNANEACIFAAILKCTRAGRGWYGNYRELAAAMPFVMSRQTASRAVDKLLTLGLIEVRENETLWATITEQTSVQNGRQTVQNGQTSVQNGRQTVQIVPPPNNPPINNNMNEKEKEQQRALCARDCESQAPSFEDLIKAYEEKAGRGQLARNGATDLARDAWNKCSKTKKVKLVEAIKSGAHFKQRLDWSITDFPEPQPDFLRGDEPGDLVQVKYGDRIKICTRATMELFGLEWYADWNS